MLFSIHAGVSLSCAHDLVLSVQYRVERWRCPWVEAKSGRYLQEMSPFPRKGGIVNLSLKTDFQNYSNRTDSIFSVETEFSSMI